MELKHLAPYLPYGLKVKYVNLHVCKMAHGGNHDVYDGLISLADVLILSPEAKPLLRPLDDLTKPIKVEGYNSGEPFHPLEHLTQFRMEYVGATGLNKKIYRHHYQCIKEYLIGFAEVKTMGLQESLGIINLLLQWHFDIHGLIKKGQALNLNDE